MAAYKIILQVLKLACLILFLIFIILHSNEFSEVNLDAFEIILNRKPFMKRVQIFDII